jgi:glycosyltransferase involved in cell wall biosynthesis
MNSSSVDARSDFAAVRTLDAAGRVALVHDWLTGMRGGEKCLEVLCELLPRAPVFTLLHVPGSVAPVIEARQITTSFVQHLPGAVSGYRRYLPLFPRAIETLDLRGFDLVLSTSHCVAKGVQPVPGALHVCYCHTPMRYVWDQFDAYFGAGRAGICTRAAAHAVRGALQRWDVRTASRVHTFVANSEHVRRRIQRYYQREAVVVHPPVDCSAFAPEPTGPNDYFLVVSAFAPYKRVDLAVEACRRAGARLVVVGQGPDAARLARLAHGAPVEFLPWQPARQLAQLYARCKALLFPGEEDFGISPVECMAAGRPVIALGVGGALETVVDGATGVLLPDDDPARWAATLNDFRADAFDPAALHAHALRFDRTLYAARMQSLIAGAWAEWSAARHSP